MLRPREFAFIAIALFPLLLAAAPADSAPKPQPVQYSHKIHVTDNKIDCRFCHSSARRSKYAGIPSVEKCMNCHRVIAVGSPEVQKVAQYWRDRKPIPWNRVTELPDHSYFPHYRMVNAGVPCLECHPGMDKAGMAVQNREFTMGFCMDCHRKRKVSIDCWTCHY
jgi:hypothetical protein